MHSSRILPAIDTCFTRHSLLSDSSAGLSAQEYFRRPKSGCLLFSNCRLSNSTPNYVLTTLRRDEKIPTAAERIEP